MDDGTSVAGYSELMQLAGTTQVGKDGRLLTLRRQRRYRLGIRSQQLAGVEEAPTRLERDRFEQRDEEHVTDKLLSHQWEAHQGGFKLEW
jgi:hypothetical protein